MAGKAVPKARPRVVRRRDGTSQTFTPRSTANWEETVSWELRRQLLAVSFDDGIEVRLPLEDRVVVDLTFWYDKPKSYPKSLQHHIRRPDGDNLAKGVLDAMTTLGVFRDDAQVTDLYVRKRYTLNGEPEGVEMVVAGDL